MWRVTNYFQYFIVQITCSLASFLCVLFPFTDSSGCNKKTNSNNVTSLPKARNHKTKQQVQKLRHTQARTLIQKLKNYPPAKKKCTTVFGTILFLPYFLFFFNFSFLLICKKIPYCFFSMGRVSIKTYITRKSIGKIDNQKSSGIELELVAIPQPDYYTPFFFPRSM